MTKEEFKEVSNKSWQDRGGVYFESYVAALYYTQD
jgi:hypothetical protein